MEWTDGLLSAYVKEYKAVDYADLRDGLVYFWKDIFRHWFGKVYAMDLGAKRWM
jgi:hypothetical protein